MPKPAARLERLRGFSRWIRRTPVLLEEASAVALALGLGKDAQAFAERALVVKPDNPQLLVCLANAKLALGEVQAALDLLEPIARVHEGEVGLRYNYGYALLRVGRYAEAKEVLAAIVEDPRAPASTRTVLVRALQYLGEVEEARAQARKQADARPDDPVAAGVLSLLCVDAGDWKEARQWAERSLKGQPENLDALLAVGSVAIVEENPDAAQGIFEKALALRPKSYRAHMGLGAAALLKFDTARAREHFERAGDERPGDTGTLNALAWSQMLGKVTPPARATLERSLAIDRNIGDTHGGLAMLAAFQGRWDEAELHGKRARGLNPNSFGGRMVQVLKMQSAGQGEQARQKVEAGLKSAAAPGGGTLADMLIRMKRKRPPERDRNAK